MIRILLTASTLGLLAACSGGNPLFDEGNDGSDPNPDNYYATELNADLTMNAAVYDDNDSPGDPTDDKLIINNLPFDGSDAQGNGYARMNGAALAGGFDAYESVGAGEPGDHKYFAVFRRTDNSQVAAVGTGDYVGFGFGGATAQRIGNTTLPGSGEYTYTGEYAAVRITTLDGGADDVEFITGDVTMAIDFGDFDLTGAVEGIINNRDLYDNTGTWVAALDDYISLATAEIDFDNQLTLVSTATGYEIVGDVEITNGQWQSFFTGPNGEELAGFLVLEGSVPSGGDDDTVRETGVFIALD